MSSWTDKRPMSPHVSIWKWHMTMASSILHRVTGVGNYIGIFIVVAWLFATAAGPDYYEPLAGLIGTIWGQLILFGLTLSISYLLLHGLACWWIDAPIALHGVQFPFGAPPPADVYARLFASPVRFGAPRAALHFDASVLNLPLRRDAPALDQMLRRALPIMVWPYRREASLSRRVRQLLQRSQAAHTAQTLAAQLALSTRTLHRQLRDEGTSLQALKDEVRRARAADLLQRTRQPLARVARAVGFQNDKSFIRAFRHWTGRTPEQFRAQSGKTPDPRLGEAGHPARDPAAPHRDSPRGLR